MATATIVKTKPVITLTLSLEEACALYLLVSHATSESESPAKYTNNIQDVLDGLDLPYLTSSRYIEHSLIFIEKSLDSFHGEIEG